MSRPTVAYSHYQQSSLGISLRESLQDMVDAEQLSEEHAILILAQFDKTICEMLKRAAKNKASASGHLDHYRNVDDVWLWFVENVRFKVNDEVLRVDRVKIVACDGTGKLSKPSIH